MIIKRSDLKFNINLIDSELKLNIDSLEPIKALEELIKFIDNINILIENTCNVRCLRDGGCCSNETPPISYCQYLLLDNWMKTKEKNFQKSIYEKSLEIQQRHKNQYNNYLPLINGLKYSGTKPVNPYNFLYTCPFYDKDHDCTCYTVRSVPCRLYGTSIRLGKGLLKKASRNTPFWCDKYEKQFLENYDENKGVFLYDYIEIIDFIEKIDMKLINGVVYGLIPTWFCRSNEENFDIVKRLVEGEEPKWTPQHL